MMKSGLGLTLGTLCGLALAACSSTAPTGPDMSLSGAGSGVQTSGGMAGTTATGGVAGSSAAGSSAGGTGGGVTSSAGTAAMAGTGGTTQSAGAGGGAGMGSTGPATLISETGLYSDTANDVLAPGVMEFAPQFALWTDGAAKRRWIYIPPGTQIDNTNQDEWKFPVGTKLWKEFSRDDIRIETRMLEKLPEERASEGFEGWYSVAFVWNDEQTDAVVTPEGIQNAKGTDHDVPAQEACGNCHDMRKEKALGFSAVQLSHDGEGANLMSISAAGWLKVPATANLVVPGDESTRQMLGYFHGNCGHCHRARAPANNRVSTLLLWLETAGLGSVEETPAYQGLVGQFTESGHGSIFDYRVVGGDPDNSEVVRRMSERGDTPIMVEGEEIRVPMPPLGTELVDTDAVARVRAWIESLPPPPAAGAGGMGAGGAGVGGTGGGVGGACGSQ